ncbi:tRNA (adenosine(37)-N6)-threonylcarbamoyltransferase complex dimerization subunit type 1 TsaB [soil metagenome]
MSPPTGPVLALDTSTATGSVAVGAGDKLLAEVVLRVGAGHSSTLLPAIDYAMRSAGLAAADLQAVVVGAGPGSFTGVRVAAATAKGIVHALGAPLFAFSGLLAIAAASGFAGRDVCAVLDARRRDVFAACYAFDDRGVREVFPPEAFALDALLDRFRGVVPPVFAGEGAMLHREEIKQALGASVVPEFAGVPRASALLWLLQTVPHQGLVADPATWEPEYLRASGAERIAAAAVRP